MKHETKIRLLIDLTSEYHTHRSSQSYSYRLHLEAVLLGFSHLRETKCNEAQSYARLFVFTIRYYRYNSTPELT